MGREMLRILQITLGAVASLLVVPVAVNIGTGGAAPGWLQPYVNWLWPVALGCVAAIVVIQFGAERGGRPAATGSVLHPGDSRNAALALAQVSRYIEGRQSGALDERLRLALALDERPTAVRHTLHLVQRVSGEEFQLSEDLRIADVFDQMDESLLILGAPGAGKTTQLLDLAAALIRRAAASGGEAPIPVVVDLADWSRSGFRPLALIGRDTDEPRDFVEWLLATLKRRYRIPEPVSRSWLRANRLTLLLDGLDEVRESDRDRCLTEINNLQEHGGATRIVVCSRESDYQLLPGRLRLQGAVSIRPLTRAQVMAHFARVSPHFAGTAEALRADRELWELLTTPLMLTIMTLAQNDATWLVLSDQAGPEERRRLLFDAYVVEVLARRRAGSRRSPLRTLRALQTLAAGAVRINAGVRVLTPDDDLRGFELLSGPGHTVAGLRMFPAAYVLCATVIVTALATSASVAVTLPCAALLVVLLAREEREEPQRPVQVARPVLMLGTMVAIVVAATGTFLVMFWTAAQLQKLPAGYLAAIAVVIGFAIMGLLRLLVDNPSSDRYQWLAVLCGCLVAALALGVGLTPAAITAWALGCGAILTFLGLCAPFDVEASARPEVGVTRRPRLSLLLPFAIALAAPATLLPGSWFRPLFVPLAGFAAGLATGLFPAAFVWVKLVGPAMRLTMAVAGEPIPWQRSFLTFAADRSILACTDGEYRFIHLLVRDHLAACDPDQLARSVERRRVQLEPA